MEYTFYFDESFHDRVIKLNKQDVLNTMSFNALDSYIGVFWGCPNNIISHISSKLCLFEAKYRKRFGLDENQEMKSQIIAKKNYTHGIRSFNKDSYDFYYDLFSIIKEEHPILQIEIISKTEIIVRKLYDSIIFDRRYSIIKDVFIYSLTKFIIVYHTQELLVSLFNIHDAKTSYNFRKILLNHLKCILDNTKGIKRKQREYAIFKELHHIISKCKINYISDSEIAFSYIPNFSGLSLLLSELNIQNTDVSVIIDNEEKTFQAAQLFSFSSVKQVDSRESIQVRLSDWISGFIGRMIFALQNDEKMLEDKINHIEDILHNDLTTKRILSKEWFEITEKQFNLYLLIYNSLIIGHEHYWTAMTTVNSDQAIMFYALLRHFSAYETYEQYSSTEPAKHSEYFNTRVVLELEEYFKRIENR